MTYSLALNSSIVPAATAFSVKVNNVTRNVSSVIISGTKVTLNLSSPIAFGEVVTIAYTQPATNPLQTPAGGKAATLSAKTVVNNVGAPPPVYVSSVVEDADPSVLVMTYSIALANIIPAASSFTVNVNSVANAVNSVSISGTSVLLSLATPIEYGNTVTVSYTQPAKISYKPLQELWLEISVPNL